MEALSFHTQTELKGFLYLDFINRVYKDHKCIPIIKVEKVIVTLVVRMTADSLQIESHKK